MRILTLLALAVWAVATPDAVSAEWSAPRTLTSGARAPAAIAGNDRGDVVAAWPARDGIRVATARRGRAFGPAVLVPRSGQTDFEVEYLHVAINRRGDVVVAWDDHALVDEETTCCDFVVASSRRAGGRFGRAQRLTNPRRTHSNRSAVTIGPAGRVAVTWEDECNPRAVVGSVGRRLPKPFAITTSGCRTQLAQPAILNSGDALFTYATERAGQAELWSMRVNRKGSVSRRLVQRGSPPDLTNPQVVTAGDGSRALLWDREGQHRVGVLSRAGVLRSRARGPHDAFGALDGARSGAAVALFEEIPKPGLSMSVRRPGQGFGRTIRLPRYIAGSTDAAVAPSGGLLLTWQDSASVGAALRVPGGRFRARMKWRCRRCDPSFELKGEREGLSAEIDGRGKGVIVWLDGKRVRYVRDL